MCQVSMRNVRCRRKFQMFIEKQPVGAGDQKDPLRGEPNRPLPSEALLQIPSVGTSSAK